MESTRIRILHTVPSLNAADGGPARSVPALAEAEAEAGAEVVVWSKQSPTIALDEFPGVRFVTGRITDALSAAWSPDVIHDHGLWLRANHKSASLGITTGIPRIVSPRGMLETWCLRHHVVRKKVAWHVYQQRDLQNARWLHATSPAEISTFRQLGLTQPIINLPNGVTPPEWNSSSPNLNSQRRFIYVSRIHPVKGLLQLLTAWSETRPENCRLDIYGPAENGHDDEIRHHIRELSLEGCVAIHGAVDNDKKWDLVRQADVLVLPSFSENFGNIVAEALAMATPVLTTTGTPWEGLHTHRCGWWVPPDVSGLCKGLTHACAASASQLQLMGTRGREWVLNTFLWRSIGAQMLNAYCWLLKDDFRQMKPACVSLNDESESSSSAAATRKHAA